MAMIYLSGLGDVLSDMCSMSPIPEYVHELNNTPPYSSISVAQMPDLMAKAKLAWENAGKPAYTEIQKGASCELLKGRQVAKTGDPILKPKCVLPCPYYQDLTVVPGGSPGNRATACTTSLMTVINAPGNAIADVLGISTRCDDMFKGGTELMISVAIYGVAGYLLFSGRGR